MIVYSADKSAFLHDVRSNTIHTKIHAEFQRRMQHRVGVREVDSWRNSMQFMSSALHNSEIPDDARVSIEFSIPLTSKRVDFILTGQDPDRRDVAVIVELKQWSALQATDKDGIVMTRLGGRQVETAHPSYQAWTYAALIEDYNETVRDEQIALQPCAYLHNLDTADQLHDARYADHIAKAPAFIAEDALKLSEFLSRHVRYGDRSDILYRIEHGRIRPSKSLADCLSRMMSGNAEFHLIDDQKLVYETALDLAHRAQRGARQVLIVQGGPGTGKSVVAINLLVELTRRELLAQYISRNAAPRAVYAAKLAGTLRKNRIHNLFRGSGAFMDVEARFFDALIVDEAHRLNEKSGLYGNQGENQIKELVGASKFSVFFLDEDQRVTLKDVGSAGQIRSWAKHHDAVVHTLNLASQFRCGGSTAFLAFLDDALQVRQTANPTISADEFDFRVFADPGDLHQCIREKNRHKATARMVAGYCWDWRSKKDPAADDIVLADHGYAAQWNLERDGSLWIIAPESVEQVGCIHTCQGLEVDYIGVIIGPDFVIRDGRAVTDATQRSRMDASVRGIRRWLKDEPAKAQAAADRIIKNTYRTLMTRGQKGCYVYCTDAETAEYFRQRILAMDAYAYASAEADPKIEPGSAPFANLPLRLLPTGEVKPHENALPVFDLKIAAGAFSEEQLPVGEEWAELPSHIRPDPSLFIARVVGESMNRRIPNGAWCLFRFNPGGTRNGKIVLVSSRDIHDSETGERYTIKRYFSEKTTNSELESITTVVTLRPESNDERFQPFVLHADSDTDVRVVAEFLQVLD